MVEGAAVPAAAVVVGAGAVMARLGRETLMPESFITMAGRIVQIRIREGRRTKDEEFGSVVLAGAESVSSRGTRLGEN